MSNTAIVDGAGIVGLATARALALHGYAVTVIEKSYFAVGASIRNFGMVWPIGQADGELYHRALRSREIWKEIETDCGIWHHESGSLHPTHHVDEWQVLQEPEAAFKQSKRPVQLLSGAAIAEKYGAVNTTNLLGGL